MDRWWGRVLSMSGEVKSKDVEEFEEDFTNDEGYQFEKYSTDALIHLVHTSFVGTRSISFRQRCSDRGQHGQLTLGVGVGEEDSVRRGLAAIEVELACASEVDGPDP